MTQKDLEQQAAIISLVHELRARNNWCGKTQVHKSAYFVHILSGGKLDFNFVLYKHGPFSFDLADALGTMDTLSYLGFEVTNPRYGPRLKDSPEAFAMLTTNFGTLAASLKKEIDFVADQLAEYGVASLERFATALYFTKQEIVDGVEARAGKICEVKPHIEVKEALDAVRRVDEILQAWGSKR